MWDGREDLKSSTLPDWDSSSVLWWVAFYHGCRHNPPRRLCPLCSQPFTTGASVTPVTSWPSPKIWGTAQVTEIVPSAPRTFRTTAAGSLPQQTWDHREDRAWQQWALKSFHQDIDEQIVKLKWFHSSAIIGHMNIEESIRRKQEQKTKHLHTTILYPYIQGNKYCYSWKTTKNITIF